MGDISPNFSRHEFACKDGCNFAACDIELIDILENTRLHFGGKPLRITSGCRCAYHNGQVGGERRSYHLLGLAADFTIDDISPGKIYNYLEIRYHAQYGIGIYPDWVHFDIRKFYSRW